MNLKEYFECIKKLGEKNESSTLSDDFSVMNLEARNICSKLTSQIGDYFKYLLVLMAYAFYQFYGILVHVHPLLFHFSDAQLHKITGLLDGLMEEDLLGVGHGDKWGHSRKTTKNSA